MPLSIKLIITKAILCIALIGLGFFSLVQLQDVNQTATEISHNWLPSTISIQRMDTLTSDYRIYEVRHIYNTDKDVLHKVERRITEILFELAIVRTTYEQLISSDEERKTYETFLKLWQQYLQLSKKMIALSSEGKLAEAVALLENDSQKLFDEASNVLLRAVNLNRFASIEASKQSDDVYDQSRELIILGISLVILLAAGTGAWTLFTLRRQLGKDPGELIQITGRVIQGDYDINDHKTQHGVYKHLLTMVEALKHHIDEAKQSAQVKSEFLANMSHEIRTPMNGILGLLHLLTKTKLTEQQEDYVQKSLFSANNLLRIINDILDFSKMEAGKLELEEIPFTLQNVCDDIAALYTPKAKDQNVELIINQGEYPNLAVLGDPLRIKQVLFNFVSNALKFTEQGSITVNIQCKPPLDDTLHCVFSVQDTGIGLTQEQQERLFSAFTQADSSITRKYGGTGLGLVICKKIAKAVKGSLWAESTVGQGSTFFFKVDLPLSSETAEQPYAGLAPQAKRVCTEHLLLVEDNEINQIIAQELLEQVGYTVDVANNGAEALDMLEKTAYAAVLMDIQMPIMDGLTAAQKIRQNPAFKNLIVIAMSAHAMVGDHETSLEHGMNDHITKPIDPDVLYKTLDYWIAGKNTA